MGANGINARMTWGSGDGKGEKQSRTFMCIAASEPESRTKGLVEFRDVSELRVGELSAAGVDPQTGHLT